MMKRVLVAGATGYLGRFVAKELKSRGYFVRGLSRAPGKLDDLDPRPDEVHIGEVNRPETLEGICDSIDVVFSSVGITRQKDGLTFKDVDYQGNKNLLDVAKRAGVKKFIYVSVVDGPQLRHLDIVDAHEGFVDELNASGLDYTVVRATGFFSDMGEIYEMARKGRVYLFGNGDSRCNPIHGADLAVRCADAVEESSPEVVVGGPETMTWREIAQVAFAAQNKPVKVTSVPLWVMSLVIFITRLFSRHNAGLVAFFTAMATRNVVGPAFGKRTLTEHYQSLSAER